MPPEPVRMPAATSATVTEVPKSQEAPRSPPTIGSRSGWRSPTIGPSTTRPRAESANRRLIGLTWAIPSTVSKWGATTAMPVGARAVLSAASGSGSAGAFEPGPPGRAGGAGGGGSGLPWKRTDPTLKPPAARVPAGHGGGGVGLPGRPVEGPGAGLGAAVDDLGHRPEGQSGAGGGGPARGGGVGGDLLALHLAGDGPPVREVALIDVAALLGAL